MAKKKAAVTGRDLMYSEKKITIDGVVHKMVYSNRTYMMMERVWREVYGEKVNFQSILSDAGDGMLEATMIMFYCALRAGGSYKDTDFDAFCDEFDLTSLNTISEAAFDAAIESLPESDGDGVKNV